jgi:hypothetical protein
MNTGKMLFARLMDYLPWSTWRGVVPRLPWHTLVDGAT